MCIVAENRRRHKRSTCWSAGSKRPTLGFKQPNSSESWRTKPISRPCSGHSPKTRTLKTSCVLRPFRVHAPGGVVVVDFGGLESPRLQSLLKLK